MTNANNKSNSPFSFTGILWRSLAFMLGMVAIAFLLGWLLKGCDNTSSQGNQENISLPFDPNDPESPAPWPKDDPYKDKRNPKPIENWTDSIPNVDELPSPDRNYIPPVDSTRIAPNPEDSITQVVADEAIVIFNSKDIKADMASFAQQFKQLHPQPGYEVKYYNVNTAIMLIGIPADQLVNVLNDLPSQISDIDFKLVTNDMLENNYVPSDPGFKEAAYDEYYRLIQAYDAWDVTRGNPDVKVAIVDSYFDLSHPLLKDRHINPINIITKTSDVFPPSEAPSDMNELGVYCHGSHVAGLAIGTMDNGVGCSGIAPNCTWIPISIGDQMTTLSLIEGILYAIYQGADVVNFSVGASLNPDIHNLSLDEQIELSKSMSLRSEELWDYVVKVANDHNCMLVTSAGNDTLLMGLDSKNRSDNLIKVEAVDSKGKITDFTNFGNIPDRGVAYSTVSAPGLNLWSATDVRCTPIWESVGTKVDINNGLQEMPGTSMAAPIVAGAVALMKSKNKDLPNADIIKILKMTSKYTDPDMPIGPTIQIKDALDAIGTSYANFDELMKNHDLLVGKWKSTKVLDLISSNNEKIDELWAYFIFDTPNSGMLEYRTVESQATYTAPISVSWGNDRFTIKQHGDAKSTAGDPIYADDFICTPDADRLLNTSCQRNNKERHNFKLQKVN